MGLYVLLWFKVKRLNLLDLNVVLRVVVAFLSPLMMVFLIMRHVCRILVFNYVTLVNMFRLTCLISFISICNIK